MRCVRHTQRVRLRKQLDVGSQRRGCESSVLCMWRWRVRPSHEGTDEGTNEGALASKLCTNRLAVIVADELSQCVSFGIAKLFAFDKPEHVANVSAVSKSEYVSVCIAVKLPEYISFGVAKRLAFSKSERLAFSEPVCKSIHKPEHVTVSIAFGITVKLSEYFAFSKPELIAFGISVELSEYSSFGIAQRLAFCKPICESVHKPECVTFSESKHVSFGIAKLFAFDKPEHVANELTIVVAVIVAVYIAFSISVFEPICETLYEREYVSIGLTVYIAHLRANLSADLQQRGRSCCSDRSDGGSGARTVRPRLHLAGCGGGAWRRTTRCVPRCRCVSFGIIV